MSRRIAYLFIIAGCAVLVAPAAASAQKPARETTRAPVRPVEVVSGGPHYSVEPSPSYPTALVPSYPGGGVVVVVPGVQYGEDGVALLQGRQDSSWQLCQPDRHDRHALCGPYSYQPYGASGYRPYGSFRQYRVAPAYVYVPDARILTIDPQN